MTSVYVLPACRSQVFFFSVLVADVEAVEESLLVLEMEGMEDSVLMADTEAMSAMAAAKNFILLFLFLLL